MGKNWSKREMEFGFRPGPPCELVHTRGLDNSDQTLYSCQIILSWLLSTTKKLSVK